MFRKTFLWMIALLIIPFLYLAMVEAGDRLSESLAAAPAKFEGVIPILMYHKINPNPLVGGFGLRITPQAFEKQIDYLMNNGYTTISLSDLADHFEKGSLLPSRPVIITFDDGYKDNYTYAYPILKERGMTATIFVVAGTVGGINEFDYGSQPENLMANWEELQEMSAGGITIGAHTIRHPHLTDLTFEEARYEITESKSLLEVNLDKPVEVFSYPYGSYSSEIVSIVRESGFRAAVTTDQGMGSFTEGPFTLKRVRVRGDYKYSRFLEELTKYHNSSELGARIQS